MNPGDCALRSRLSWGGGGAELIKLQGFRFTLPLRSALAAELWGGATSSSSCKLFW